MKKSELLYEGKAKKLYKTDDSKVLWVEYLNQATALNGLRKDLVQGKGQLNNQITSLIFSELTEKGLPNHFIKKISKDEQLIEKVEMIPLEVVLRNVAAGSFSKRLGIEEGVKLDFPVIEFYLKSDPLDDPFINEDHIKFLHLLTEEDVLKIKELTLEINRALIEIFEAVGIELIDFKLEFGRQTDGTIILADEISPDTCRLWDSQTRERLDKDIYRKNLGELVPVYQEVLDRLEKNYN